jgi:hypothetical protein
MRKKGLLPGVLLILSVASAVQAQTKTPADHAVEGGKILVELIRAFSAEKDRVAGAGCRGRHADFCVINLRDTSLTVIIASRASEEKRELIITRDNRECCLQLPVGVWTYELRLSGTPESMRKGDLLIEGCNNLTMTIK